MLRGSRRLGFTNRVVAGPHGRIDEPFARQLDPSYDWAATRAGAGSWDYMEAIAQFGVIYLKTGKEVYRKHFVERTS